MEGFNIFLRSDELVNHSRELTLGFHQLFADSKKRVSVFFSKRFQFADKIIYDAIGYSKQGSLQGVNPFLDEQLTHFVIRERIDTLNRIFLYYSLSSSN